MHQEKKIAPKITAKIASVNEPLEREKERESNLELLQLSGIKKLVQFYINNTSTILLKKFTW
jgi:hypothetical protein